MPPELVIGRIGDIDELERRVGEAIHTMLTGDRRIGKTTVCDAACDRVQRAGMVIVEIEVPERPDATALLQLVVDRCSRISLAARGRRALRVARPLIEKVLRDEGIPLDLGQLGADPGALPTRTILSLPLKLAEETGQRVVFFLDELQRAVDYADGEQVLGDLVDLYSGSTDVIVLVDGSKERALEGMLGAGLELLPEALELLVVFGDGRPYATMTAARYAALNARKLGSESVGTFEGEEGVAEARRHLDEDA